MSFPGPAGATGPRVLLRRIRELMALPLDGQQRLDRLVNIIAGDIVAEVCSIYIRRAGDVLELFATQGLNPSAVHTTRLRVGEGLVGEIARTAEPLRLTDAPNHPKFAYLPETGEDPFHSFLGVPILKNGQVLGVLVVQNKTARLYDDEELEALQTVAMVVAEVAASGELILLDESVVDIGVRPNLPHLERGTPFAEGIAMGEAFLHAAPIGSHPLIAEDVETEVKRLDQAIASLRAGIDKLLQESEHSLIGEPRDVLETYRMFADDAGWHRRMREAIRNGLTAEAAVEQVQSDMRARMMRQSDPYIRERMHDLDDLSHRLLRILSGEEDRRQLPERAIVFARNLGPAELLEYDQERLTGLILEEGSPNAHVAIVARALRIPLVGRISDVLELVRDGDDVLVDGSAGEVHIRPSREIFQAFEAKILSMEAQEAEFYAHRHDFAETLDGHSVQLNINAGLQIDLANLEEVGADGIGLFRTELQFMVSSTFPRLGAQVEFYTRVLDAADKKPVVFRTLDLGGDKFLPYGNFIKEENPALGLRAVRFALARPALLRYQLRALLVAAAGRSLNLMFPMVTEIGEFRQAQALLEREVERLESFRKPLPQTIRVGSMIEVPSLVWQLPELLDLVDFVSIGSNDLMQFFFATDRSNPAVSTRYSFLSPSVMRLLGHISQECSEKEVPLSICGEVASRPLEVMALLGLGLRSLSMPASGIGRVKSMVRKLHISSLEQLIKENDGKPAAVLEGTLREHAATLNIPLADV